MKCESLDIAALTAAGPKGGTDLSPGAALAMYLTGPAKGPSAIAMADVLLATIQRSSNPAQQFGAIATNLIRSPAPLDARRKNGILAGSADISDTNGIASPNGERVDHTGKGEGENGHPEGRLLHLHTLVMQLSELLSKSSGKASDWRSPRLDAVAHLLLRPEWLGADDRAWQVKLPVWPPLHDGPFHLK